jgi:hypothetical protein
MSVYLHVSFNFRHVLATHGPVVSPVIKRLPHDGPCAPLVENMF